MKKGYLVLQDGQVFEGFRFGGPADAVGELVFTTGMCGYLETLTDPSYAGQIVMQTYPLIGNYGIIPEDFEGACCVRGYVVREWCEEPSNFRCQKTLDEFLKEQGIIGQEIRMIEDQPGWQAYHLLLEAMYQHHPVRNSVAGSVESISHITAETLYHCHEAFYTPSNMVLCVVGNVDPEKVCQMARDILPQEKKPPIPRDCGAQESQQVFRQEDSRTMAVSAPLLQMGIKGTAAPDGPSQIRQRLLGELACEILVGSSSPLYNRLYEEGLINSGFYCGYLDYPGCAFLMAGGESQHPEQVRDAILQEGARLAREGVDEALFQRLKKASYGAYVRSLNSFENLCVEQAQGYFAGGDPWTFPELYDTMERQDVEAFLAQWVKPEQTSLVVIRPQEERS